MTYIADVEMPQIGCTVRSGAVICAAKLGTVTLGKIKIF